MLNFRCFLSGTLLLALAALAGCSMFSADAWQRPSPLSGRPLPPEKQGKREFQGGFTVQLDDPDRPPAARVVTDIGAYAQRRGFVLQAATSAPQLDPATGQALAPAPQRYSFGSIVLDVIYQPSDLRVVADLHSFSFKLGHGFADRFFHDFDHEYAGRYGQGDPIFENDYTDDTTAPVGDRSGRGGGSSGRR